MTETIQMSPAIKWFIEKMEQCMMDFLDAFVFFSQERFHRMADGLAGTLQYSHDKSEKINNCVELAVQIMGIAWSIEHYKQQEKS